MEVYTVCVSSSKGLHTQGIRLVCLRQDQVISETGSHVWLGTRCWHEGLVR